MIVERTEYFAKPGMEAEVLAVRRRACAVRREIGLASGRIFVAQATSEGETPAVVWECDFADADAHAADLAARAASPAFGAVRADMTKLLTRFARHVLERDDAPIGNGMRPTALGGLPIVPKRVTFASQGRELAGYLWLPPGEGPFPCLVTNHGSGIDRDTWDVSRPGTAMLLMEWGIASFLPHRHGYGDSPGPAGREEASAEFGTEEYVAQVAARLDRESDDVLAALDFVAGLPAVDAGHVGVMGSSFGGINTLLAASKSERFTCAVEFAGAAMNWDRTPRLRAKMLGAAQKLTQPVFFIQAANDYSIRPTPELAASLEGTGKTVWSKVYPAFGITPMEGHLLESRGAPIWAADVHRFLERWL
jgi:dienelactone hydrolase